MKLTNNQTEFLANNSISIARVLDATGLRPKTYKSLMKDLDKDLAIGVTICNRGHDSMRTRAGHCIFCNPQAMLHQNRFKQEAHNYLAISTSCKLIKIGFSENPSIRESKLKTEGYGGAKDWIVISHFRCKNAGRAEYQIQQSLSQYSYPTLFNKDGHDILCKETFKCSTAIAIETFLAAYIDESREEIWIHPQIDQIGFDVLNVDKKTQAFTKKTQKLSIDLTNENTAITSTQPHIVVAEGKKQTPTVASPQDLTKGDHSKQENNLITEKATTKSSPQEAPFNSLKANQIKIEPQESIVTWYLRFWIFIFWPALPIIFTIKDLIPEDGLGLNAERFQFFFVLPALMIYGLSKHKKWALYLNAFVILFLNGLSIKYFGLLGSVLIFSILTYPMFKILWPPKTTAQHQ